MIALIAVIYKAKEEKNGRVAEVITTGDFPAYNYSGGKERNDTLIRYNGELYFIQKRFLEKVI